MAMKNKILVIDDDLAVLEILTEWLNEEGFQVMALPKVANISSLVKSYRPDLVLIDYQLNGIHGGELCLALKNDKALSHIPVVLFSAFPEGVIIPDRFKCDLFIQKPFDLYELVENLQALLVGPGQVYSMELN